MSLAYTRIDNDAFQQLVLNAGFLCDEFNPATGEVTGRILGATSGGISFATNPNFVDFGEDVDNVPPNTKQLKRITYFDPTASGTFLTCTPSGIASLIGSADVQDTIKVVPREQLVDEDFDDVWMVGDYSDVNTGANAGFLAIHLKNALNTTGFQIQTGKDAKGTMSFEYHAHYDLDDMSDIPFEVYCKSGSSSTGTPENHLNKHSVTVAINGKVQLTATTKNYSGDVTWNTGSGTIATVSGGEVTGKAAGNTIITASISDGGVTYNDTCTVIVPAAT